MRNFVMDLDDSFFEDCACGKKRPKQTERVKYSVRRCEPEWFLQDDASLLVAPDQNFMLLKYKADFLYSRKQYAEATPLYCQILLTLPKTNALFKREVTDSLVRCFLQTGEYGKALEQAKLLVLPPHDRDCSSWRVLAECYRELGMAEAQTLALQRCAELQRHHPHYWTELSEAYRALCEKTERSDEEEMEKSEKQVVDSYPNHRVGGEWYEATVGESHGRILDTMGVCEDSKHSAALSKDHKVMLNAMECSLDGEKQDGEKRDGDKQNGEKQDGEKRDGEKRDGEKRGSVAVDACEESKRNIHSSVEVDGLGNQRASGGSSNILEELESILNNTLALFRPYFSWRSLPDSETVCEFQMGEMTSRPNIRLPQCTNSQATPTSSARHVKCCHEFVVSKHCIESSCKHRVASSVSNECCHSQALSYAELGYLPTTSLVKSPFVVLASRRLSVCDFVSHLQRLPQGRRRQLLGSFFTMSACSCLIWARQLLLYSVRYSESFVKTAQRRELQRVEQLLGGFHGNTKLFLLEYFHQSSVFDVPAAQKNESEQTN